MALKGQHIYLSGVGLLSLIDLGLVCVGDLDEDCLDVPCNLDVSFNENLGCLGVDNGCSLEADGIDMSMKDTDLGVAGCDRPLCTGVTGDSGLEGSKKDTDL